ncbi:hypothetical protein MNV49_004689 [Pseudohyphozyma bogoriensis]|nr:hypothetical protein MNV49_004689 [Pseudohyphozyma bogoriensis]
MLKFRQLVLVLLVWVVAVQATNVRDYHVKRVARLERDLERANEIEERSPTDVGSEVEGPKMAKRAAVTVPTLTIPYNTANPGATPQFIIPAVPVLLDGNTAAKLILATVTPITSLLQATATALVQAAGGIVNGLVTTLSTVVCTILGCTTKNIVSPLLNINCLDSSYTETHINTLFAMGGANTIVYLCPSAVLSLSAPIIFTASNQTLTTYGLPLGITRATVRVTGASQTCAIYGASMGNDIKLTNIIVDGNRNNLGYVATPPAQALIELGGSVTGHTVNNIKAMEPRGWSALHIIEGTDNTCRNAVITNNQLGPAGHAPSGTAQFRMRRRDTGTYPPGQWADGISLSCASSTVTGNTVTDATDGAIVIFGSPGSTIKDNIIIADQRQLLGAINSVDYAPWFGNYTGTSVTGNTITASNSMIKVGFALGPLNWSPPTAGITSASYTFGGSWINNIFNTGLTGYFGAGITISGHSDASVTSNKFVSANFGGVNSSACFTPPDNGPLFINPSTTSGVTTQTSFISRAFDFVICKGPGAVTSSGISLSN